MAKAPTKTYTLLKPHHTAARILAIGEKVKLTDTAAAAMIGKVRLASEDEALSPKEAGNLHSQIEALTNKLTKANSDRDSAQEKFGEATKQLNEVKIQNKTFRETLGIAEDESDAGIVKKLKSWKAKILGKDDGKDNN